MHPFGVTFAISSVLTYLAYTFHTKPNEHSPFSQIPSEELAQAGTDHPYRSGEHVKSPSGRASPDLDLEVFCDPLLLIGALEQYFSPDSRPLRVRPSFDRPKTLPFEGVPSQGTRNGLLPRGYTSRVAMTRSSTSPTRLRVRDLVSDLELKSAKLREVAATLQYQFDTIKNLREQQDDAQDRLRTEERFRLEAERHARMMEDELERLHRQIHEQNILRQSLEVDMNSLTVQIEMLASTVDYDRSEAVRLVQRSFEALRTEHSQLVDEMTRVKHSFNRLQSEKMQERELKESYMRQVAELREDLAQLNLLLEERTSQLSLTAFDQENESDNDYFDDPDDPFSTPVRRPKDKAMGFAIPPATEVHLLRSRAHSFAALLPGQSMEEELSDSDSIAYESANELDIHQWDALEAIERERDLRPDIYSSYTVFARR